MPRKLPEHLKKKPTDRIKCKGCGVIYSRAHKSSHEKSQKHLCCVKIVKKFKQEIIDIREKVRKGEISSESLYSESDEKTRPQSRKSDYKRSSSRSQSRKSDHNTSSSKPQSRKSDYKRSSIKHSSKSRKSEHKKSSSKPKSSSAYPKGAACPLRDKANSNSKSSSRQSGGSKHNRNVSIRLEDASTIVTKYDFEKMPKNRKNKGVRLFINKCCGFKYHY